MGIIICIPQDILSFPWTQEPCLQSVTCENLIKSLLREQINEVWPVDLVNRNSRHTQFWLWNVIFKVWLHALHRPVSGYLALYMYFLAIAMLADNSQYILHFTVFQTVTVSRLNGFYGKALCLEKARTSP